MGFGSGLNVNVGRFCIGIILEGSRLGVGWVWVVGVG